MRTALLLLVAVDPIGVARVWPRRGWLLTAFGLTAAALVADPVLDILDLSPEGFWIAAGILLLVPAFALFPRGDHREAVGPAAVAVTIAFATRDGTVETLLGVALVTLAVLAVRSRQTPEPWLGRAIGAGMVIIALDLIRDGVIAV